MALLLIIGAASLVWYAKQPGALQLVNKIQNKDTNTPQQSFPAVVETAQIAVTANGFSPKAIYIKTGTVVTWTNTDSNSHSIRSDDLPAISTDKPLSPGDAYSFTFEKPGTYMYSDPLLPGATGTIDVE